MSASEFKAKCLAVLDEVARTGQPVTILKRGKAVAQLVPAAPRSSGFPQDTLAGMGRTVGDIVAPAVEPKEWDAERTP